MYRVHVCIVRMCVYMNCVCMCIYRLYMCVNRMYRVYIVACACHLCVHLVCLYVLCLSVWLCYTLLVILFMKWLWKREICMKVYMKSVSCTIMYVWSTYEKIKQQMTYEWCMNYLNTWISYQNCFSCAFHVNIIMFEISMLSPLHQFYWWNVSEKFIQGSCIKHAWNLYEYCIILISAHCVGNA